MEDAKRISGGALTTAKLPSEDRNYALAVAPSSASSTSLSVSDGRKVVIKSADMKPDLQKEAVDVAISAFEKYNVEKDVAENIKKQFDKKYGPTWHCIVGKNFDMEHELVRKLVLQQTRRAGKGGASSSQVPEVEEPQEALLQDEAPQTQASLRGCNKGKRLRQRQADRDDEDEVGELPSQFSGPTKMDVSDGSDRFYPNWSLRTSDSISNATVATELLSKLNLEKDWASIQDCSPENVVYRLYSGLAQVILCTNKIVRDIAETRSENVRLESQLCLKEEELKSLRDERDRLKFENETAARRVAPSQRDLEKSTSKLKKKVKSSWKTVVEAYKRSDKFSQTRAEYSAHYYMGGFSTCIEQVSRAHPDVDLSMLDPTQMMVGDPTNIGAKPANDKGCSSDFSVSPFTEDRIFADLDQLSDSE